MAEKRRGELVVISGPSGSGKSTVLKMLQSKSPIELKASVSATTRPPRQSEVDGVDYHFISEEEFKRRQKRGDFLESFQVFESGHLYGTLEEEVTPSLDAGKWVVLEIDVQGAIEVMKRYPEAITIFVHPGSVEELATRLRGRATESEGAIGERLARAKKELEFANRYRYQIVNDDLDRAVREVCDILSLAKG